MNTFSNFTTLTQSVIIGWIAAPTSAVVGFHISSCL